VSGHNDDGVDHADPVVTILFIVFGLGVGILIQQMLSKLGDPVPYTVVVFIAGLIFSSWNRDNAGLYVEHRLITIYLQHCYLYDDATHEAKMYCAVFSSMKSYRSPQVS